MIAADDPELAILPGARYILRNLRTIDTDALSRNVHLQVGFVAMRKEPPPLVVAEIAERLPEAAI